MVLFIVFLEIEKAVEGNYRSGEKAREVMVKSGREN